MSNIFHEREETKLGWWDYLFLGIFIFLIIFFGYLFFMGWFP